MFTTSTWRWLKAVAFSIEKVWDGGQFSNATLLVNRINIWQYLKVTPIFIIFARFNTLIERLCR